MLEEYFKVHHKPCCVWCMLHVVSPKPLLGVTEFFKKSLWASSLYPKRDSSSVSLKYETKF